VSNAQHAGVGEVTSRRRLKRILLPVSLPLLGACFACGLLAWAPWITPEDAERMAADRFTQAWSGGIDGCGFNCSGCGSTFVRRIPFGMLVEMEYACGMIPADTPEYHERSEVFVSLFGSVFGLNAP